MHSLPDSESYLLVRTDFGDEAGWTDLRAQVDEGSDEGFVADVIYVDDPQYESASSEALQSVHPKRAAAWAVMYLADELAIRQRHHPVLVVRVGNPADRPFRCRADLLYEVDANLSLANLDWDDFRRQLDESGVYGGTDIRSPVGEPAPYVDPALAAHASTPSHPVTIVVPPQMWFEMHEDLFEISAMGLGGKKVRVIAERINGRLRGGGAVVPRMRPEDDVVVTFPANEWAFIRERARQMVGANAIADNGRDRSGIAKRNVQLISQHIG